MFLKSNEIIKASWPQMDESVFNNSITLLSQHLLISFNFNSPIFITTTGHNEKLTCPTSDLTRKYEKASGFFLGLNTNKI